MVQLLLIILFSLAPVTKANCQHMRGGIEGGLAASQIDGDTYAGFNKGGLIFGFFTETSFNSKWTGKLSIRYTGKGAAKRIGDDPPVYYKRTLHYFEFPVTAGMDINNGLTLLFGVVPAYKFAEADKNSFPGDFNDYKTFDLGWLLGIGYVLSKQIILRAEYEYSLVSINNGLISGNQYSWFARAIGYNKGAYNNAICLTAGFFLGR